MDSTNSPSRRSFIAASALAGLGVLQSPSLGESSLTKSQPYSNVVWEDAQQVRSVSHAHCRSQTSMNLLCRRGLTHLAISNYYPSVPCRIDERVGEYKVSQSFATVDGKYKTGETFLWNNIIRDTETGWFDSLPVGLRDAMPFKMGSRCFTEVPTDVIICPNAEHHSMTDSRGHFNGLGSLFASGTFDVRGKYLLHKHSYAMGTGLSWRESFERIFDALQFADGGGVTINHPGWSSLSAEHTHEMLDFDKRVLGLEIWNQTTEQLSEKGWSLDIWDSVLATGRRCWGFAVPDHAHNRDPAFRGQNVLLIPKSTTAVQRPAACLRAYRNGDFYVSMDGGLALNQLTLTGDALTVEVSEKCNIRFVTARGVVHEQAGSACSWKLPTGDAWLRNHVFIRVEAKQADGDDQVFSQPFSLT